MHIETESKLARGSEGEGGWIVQGLTQLCPTNVSTGKTLLLFVKKSADLIIKSPSVPKKNVKMEGNKWLH